MHNVLVVGICGAGKSTLARDLAARLNVRHVELDALRHGPGWTVRADFAERVDEATAEPGWVVDSDAYPDVVELLWSRAGTVVWLDLAQPVVLVRVARRTWRRVAGREELWGGNHESVRDVLTRQHPIAKVLLDHRARRDRLAARVAGFPGPTVRLATAGEAGSWLAGGWAGTFAPPGGGQRPPQEVADSV